MSLENSSDLAGFFDTSTLGVAATYTVQSGSSVTINGIFEKDFFLVSGGQVVGVESNKPTFICKTSDVSSASNGDSITISSVAYTVRGVQSDGTGMTTLILERN